MAGSSGMWARPSVTDPRSERGSTQRRPAGLRIDSSPRSIAHKSPGMAVVPDCAPADAAPVPARRSDVFIRWLCCHLRIVAPWSRTATAEAEMDMRRCLLALAFVLVAGCGETGDRPSQDRQSGASVCRAAVSRRASRQCPRPAVGMGDRLRNRTGRHRATSTSGSVLIRPDAAHDPPGRRWQSRLIQRGDLEDWLLGPRQPNRLHRPRRPAGSEPSSQLSGGLGLQLVDVLQGRNRRSPRGVSRRSSGSGNSPRVLVEVLLVVVLGVVERPGRRGRSRW